MHINVKYAIVFSVIVITCCGLWWLWRYEGFEVNKTPDETRTVDYPVYQNNKDVALESGAMDRKPDMPVGLEGKIISTPTETQKDVARGGEISTPDVSGFCDEMMMISNQCG